jgi:hypothetical protein
MTWHTAHGASVNPVTLLAALLQLQRSGTSAGAHAAASTAHVTQAAPQPWRAGHKIGADILSPNGRD